MRKLLTGLAVAGLVVLAGAPPASAQVPAAVAHRPGATLLLPYFEVNYGTGLSTVMSINNASATAVLAHVTVWSDLGVPVMNFDTYLTGFDMIRVDLGHVLAGSLPRTASVGQDPADTSAPNDGISNKGPYSQDINFASCTSLPPTPMSASFVAHVKAALTGKPSAVFGGLCAGVPAADGTLRGYVTVDTVNACNTLSPADPGYWPFVTDQNVLWGDYYYRQPSQLVGRGAPLVSIFSDPMNPETSVAGEYTFYGRYNAWTAIDNREPLGTTFMARYQARPGFKSYVTVWRDSKVNQAPFSCGSLPSWYPLGHEQIGTFDEFENPEVPPPPFVYPPVPALEYSVPAATQKILVDSAALPVSFTSGFLYLNLNHVAAAAGANPPEDPAAAQAWVTPLFDSGGYKFSSRAVQMDSAMEVTHTYIPF